MNKTVQQFTQEGNILLFFYCNFIVFSNTGQTFCYSEMDCTICFSEQLISIK